MGELIPALSAFWIVGWVAGSFAYCLVKSERVWSDVYGEKPTKEEFKAYVKICLFFIFCVALFCPITYPVLGVKKLVKWYRSLE